MDALIRELQRANDTLRCPLQDTDAQQREDAQAAYVEQWRADHPRAMWLTPWVCPLCRKAVQDIPANERYQPHDIETHQ